MNRPTYVRGHGDDMCPICNHRFSPAEKLLREMDQNFQCRSCWNPVGLKRSRRDSLPAHVKHGKAA